jgi:hypothetical protein
MIKRKRKRKQLYYYNGPLTEKDRKLFDFIVDMRNWRPPSYPQMREYMGVRSNQAIRNYIVKLEKKGYLRFKRGKITIL